MAVISDTYEFVYVLNPRTASTATAKALVEQADGVSVPEKVVKDEKGKILVPIKHCSIKQLRKHGIVPEDKLGAYFKFVTVRNPYDSIVSFWAKMTQDYAKLLDRPNSWVHNKPGYADSMRRAMGKSFPEWVKDTYPEKIANGDKGSINGRMVNGTDHVLRYENIEEDFEGVKARLNFPADLTIPRINVTAGREEQSSYQDFYDDESRALIATYFAEEIASLGYEF